ncbi:MAG: PKD domain-containing protein [Crocinitomicaceae bacterium]|nr:PKD domain-containing protein [Crocinitomicaceae bacterium]
MKHLVLLFSLFLIHFYSTAGDSLRVLFIGNSYTYVNDLPNVIKDMAAVDGNYLEHASSTPGGQTLQQHCSNTTTLNLIRQGDWDYVVIQEQSQVPSFPDGQVISQFYPYVKQLNDSIHKYNPCAKNMFYVTWGRKNGDAQNCPYFTPLCTYEGMDNLLTLRYTNAADTINAILSPVGPLWRELRTNHASIELYSSDESHPSPAGTYAAACSFYSMLFNRSLENNNYDFTLNATDAATIRNVAETVVYNNRNYWLRFVPELTSAFSYTQVVDSYMFSFNNQSENATSVSWDFGDGSPKTTNENPSHIYSQAGTYTVCLTAYTGEKCDSITTCQTITLTLGVEDKTNSIFRIYPNPAKDFLTIENNLNYPKYEIVDVLGNTIQKGEIAIKTGVIPIKELKTGVYFLVLKTDSSNKQFRFVKE